MWLFFVYHAFLIVPSEFGNFVFWGERKPRIPREKSLGAEKQHLQPQPTDGVTSGIRTQATLVEGKCCDHTAPALLPFLVKTCDKSVCTALYVELGKRLDMSFLITVNYLVSDHPWCTTKWLHTGRWSSMGKIKKKIQPELINVIT